MISLPPALQDAPQACRALFKHWDEIRDGALVPRRGQIDPAQLVAILPRLQILELQSRSVTYCRLVGTGLCDLFGFDFTGRNLIEMAPPEGRRTRSYRQWSLVLQPCGSVYTGFVPFGSGAIAPVVGVALPLLPDIEGGPPQIISALAPLTDRGWVNERRFAGIGMADHVECFDIGAGVPAGIDPPDDWQMD